MLHLLWAEVVFYRQVKFSIFIYYLPPVGSLSCPILTLAKSVQSFLNCTGYPHILNINPWLSKFFVENYPFNATFKELVDLCLFEKIKNAWQHESLTNTQWTIA